MMFEKVLLHMYCTQIGESIKETKCRDVFLCQVREQKIWQFSNT